MKLLGIDIGSSSIKAVEVDASFRRFQISEYYEERIPPGVPPLEALRALIGNLPRMPDRVAVSVPAEKTTFRNLKLPTKDRKAIQASVAFELEDELPFPEADLIFDSVIIEQKGNVSDVFVAGSLKSHVQTYLGELQSRGVDPDLMTTEAWAYRETLNRWLLKESHAQYQKGPLLLLDIGHSRTLLYVHHQGKPVAIRVLSLGGQDLNLSIQAKYQLTSDQAEKAKRDQGFVLPPSQYQQANRDQQVFSDALMGPLAELLKEIRQTNLICKNLTKEPILAILTTGGSSLLPGLSRVIEEDSLIPVSPVRFMAELGNSELSYADATEAHFGLAASLALTLMGGGKARPIQLRTRELAKRGKVPELPLEQLKKPLLAAAAILFCMVLSLSVRGMHYGKKNKDLDAQLSRAVRSFFTEMSASNAQLIAKDTPRLKREIEKILNRQRAVRDLVSKNETSPMLFLRDLSSSVPRDVVTDLITFQAGAKPNEVYSSMPASSTASLTFTVANAQNIERLATILEKRNQKFERSKVEEIEGKDGQGKRFKITFTGATGGGG